MSLSVGCWCDERSLWFCVRYSEFEEEKLLDYLNIFFKRFYSQQFKRSAMPDGPKVLNISLSPRTDWRMPSDANYRRRL